ncbi:MAG: hypothetical protein ACI83P_001114 [Janthinobacterium sp.]|jgi:hypothetical protein
MIWTSNWDGDVPGSSVVFKVFPCRVSGCALRCPIIFRTMVELLRMRAGSRLFGSLCLIGHYYSAPALFFLAGDPAALLASGMAWSA